MVSKLAEVHRRTSIQKTYSTEDPEVKRCLATIQPESFDTEARLACFSDWFKAKRAVANCIAYVRKLKQVNKENTDSKQTTQTVESMQEAKKVILRAGQHAAFPEQIKILKENDNSTAHQARRLKREDPLLRLDPEVDRCGILRAGGKVSAIPAIPGREASCNPPEERAHNASHHTSLS